MASFAYTARDAQGKTMRDVISAASRKEALRVLMARGLQPLELKESTNAGVPIPLHQPAARIVERQPVARDLLPFLKALTELTSSGLSPGEEVRLLANRMKEPRLRTLCGRLWDRLKE